MTLTNCPLALTADIERYALPHYVREDYLCSYEGDRFVESMRYVRTYPTELPILRGPRLKVSNPLGTTSRCC